MKVWSKPEMWELSAKYTEKGIPFIPTCHSGGKGSGSDSGHGSGGSSGGKGSGCDSFGNGRNNNKKSSESKKKEQKAFNLLAWLLGKYY